MEIDAIIKKLECILNDTSKYVSGMTSNEINECISDAIENIRLNRVMFSVTPYKCKDTEVFVRTTEDVGDGTIDDIWIRKNKSKLKPEDNVIKCCINNCGNTATIIDHCWPYENLMTRCNKHKKAKIDSLLYNERGIAREVNENTYSLINLLSNIKSVIDKKMILCDDSDSEELLYHIVRTKECLEFYISRKREETNDKY